jgi:hypothetical protein
MSVQDLLTKAALQGNGGSFGNLPAMMAALVQAMQTTAADIGAIRESLTSTAPSDPDTYAHWGRIDQTNGWQTAEQAVVVGILASSDTSDFFGLQVGNDTQYLIFGLTSYVPQWVDLTGAKRIPVTRGTTLRVLQQTSGGSAVVKAYACYLPGDDWGQKSK